MPLRSFSAPMDQEMGASEARFDRLWKGPLRGPVGLTTRPLRYILRPGGSVSFILMGASRAFSRTWKPLRNIPHRSVMRDERGSALAEMALLTSVYVILATAAVYLGNIALVKIGAQTVAGMAATQPGVQMLADVEDQVPKFSVVTVDEFSDTIDEEEMFDSYDIIAALEELGRAPVGYYTYEDGEIIYVLDEDRMSVFGQFIFDNDIQAESDEVAEIWEGWAYRSRATISCTYEPVFGEWDPIKIAGISCSSCVSGEQERGTHPGDDPDFNTGICDMLHDEPFPSPLKDEPGLWMGQEIP